LEVLHEIAEILRVGLRDLITDTKGEKQDMARNATNRNLKEAKKAKNDKFYTILFDIEIFKAAGWEIVDLTTS
jgi:hypothetical protein